MQSFQQDCVELALRKFRRGEVDRRTLLAGLAALGVGTFASDEAAAQAALIQSLLQRAHQPALLQEARQCLQQLPDALRREPELARLQSLLHWLERPVPAGCGVVASARQQVAEGHFNAAVETLLQVPQLAQRPDLQALLVELLNVLPDRLAAHGYRRRLFALLA